MRFDVAIVGAGVVGCALAHALSRYRCSVALIDREVEVGLGTSKANSGIIHGGHRAADGTAKAATEWRGNQLWGALADDLAFGFERVGDLTVAFDDRDVAYLESLLEQGRRRGVTGLELWDAARLRVEEPNLNPAIVRALHAPTSAVVNPYEACFALAEDAARNGVTLLTGRTVDAIERDADGFVVRTSAGSVAATTVVNAAGVAGDHVAALAGAETVGLRFRKGEEYLLDKRLVGFVRRVTFPCPSPTSKGILVTPTYDGTLMVGPTASWSDADDLTTSAAGAAEVFAGARRLAPGISEADCIAEFAGVRAVAADEDFHVGPTRVPGFVHAIGIQSPGLTAAPAIALDLVEHLREAGLSLEPKQGERVRAAAPIRFAALGRDEQATLVRGEPRFGRIVCRCELVTEGEVLQAIERGARTMDGVKFRTRAGMGRCQGGFCAWRCMRLLADAAQVDVTQVTKRGGGSWVATARVDGEPEVAHG